MTVTSPALARPTLWDWLSVVLLAAIWGASFMGVSVALQGYQPMTIAAVRILLGAIALSVVARAMELRFPTVKGAEGRRIWLHVVGMGALSNAFPFALLAWAQQHVASGFAGITMAIVPLFTLVFAHFLVAGETMTGRKALGFVVGLVGVVVLIGPAALGASGAEAENWARLACVLAAGCYSSGSIVTRLCPPVPLAAFSMAALWSATILIVPFALWTEGIPEFHGGMPLLGLIYLGIGPTALATLLLVRVVRSAGPTFLTQTNYQVPVWSVVFGAVFLNETLPPQFLGALGLILAGLAISRARAWRRRP